MQIESLLKEIKQKCEVEVRKIESPNNEEYELQSVKIESKITQIRVQQIKAYREAEDVIFY